MGRQGDLASGNGRYGLFGGKVSPFSTGWSDIAGHKYVMGAGFGRMDNTITYKTPTFAGFNLLAQYSFDKNVKKDDDAKTTGVQHGREAPLKPTVSMLSVLPSPLATSILLVS